MNKDKNLKACVYYVDGMHCASCEVLIEKKLKKLDGVKGVDASLDKGKVVLTYQGDTPKSTQINQIFEENGYSFSSEKRNREKNEPLFQKEGRNLIINKNKLQKYLKVVGLTFLILFLFLLIENSKLGGLVSISSDSSVGSFFVFGLIAGISSCAALVGGLLLSLSNQWTTIYIDEKNSFNRAYPFIMFNIGRLIAFAFLGGILGYIGSQFGLSLESKPIITAIIIGLISLYMLFLGLQMLGIDWIKKIQFKVPKVLSSKIVDEEKFRGKYMPFIVGALTFFLPCGFTLNVQAVALTSGSIFQSAAILFLFALGTLPILFLISFTSVKLAQKPKLNEMFNLISGILVVLFALYNFNAQLNVLGLPSLTDLKQIFVSSTTNYTSLIIGETQVLNTKAYATGYSPVTATVKAGMPIEWVITDDGATGCTNGIISQQLFGDKRISLLPGKNTVQIDALEPGVYKYSCWMGMYSGVIKAI